MNEIRFEDFRGWIRGAGLLVCRDILCFLEEGGVQESR
jgi:hypothetical protein